jgi:hypothetical protein
MPKAEKENTMLAKSIISAVVTACLVPSVALAQCTTAGGEATGMEYAEMVLGGESSGDWETHNKNEESTATGAFQFTYGTLQTLGYIKKEGSRTVGSDMYGPGEWQGKINWTGKDGVTSRVSFMKNKAAQVNALKKFTELNLKSINPDYSTSANGIQLTPGGVGYASHFLGDGGFKQWRSCNYQPECIPKKALESNKDFNRETLNQMLMERMAEGAGVDPSCIDASQFEGEITPVILMPWKDVGV